MFDAQPVAPPEIVRTESNFTVAAQRDQPLLYVRGTQSERALVRYSLFVRTEVTLSRRVTADPAVFDLTCDWTVAPYLQREPCLETLDGRLACAETYTSQMKDPGQGRFKVAEPDAKTCGLEAADVQAGRERLAAILRADAKTRFDDDLKRRITPDLMKAGVTVKLRP